MKLGTMLKDVTRALIKKPATEKYPATRPDTPERYRGLLKWDASGCTGCGLCSKDCPADALEVIVLDRKAKRFVVRYHPDQCVYCGACVYACRFDCLTLAHDDWELASRDPETFELLFGSEEDIAEALADASEPTAD